MSPDFLYKYRKFDAYSLSSIANQAVWLAKPSSFNDPFDCAITLDQGRYKESIMHAISVSIKSEGTSTEKKEELFKLWPGDRCAFDKYRNSLKEIFQNMGVCSFSESPDILLLWSHYADNHKGFCLEYDCGDTSRLRKLVQRVLYTDSFPKISAADMTGSKKMKRLKACGLLNQNAGHMRKNGGC